MSLACSFPLIQRSWRYIIFWTFLLTFRIWLRKYLTTLILRKLPFSWLIFTLKYSEFKNLTIVFIHSWNSGDIRQVTVGANTPVTYLISFHGKKWIFSTLFNFVRNVLAKRLHIMINKKIELTIWSNFSTISFGSNSSRLVVWPVCSKMFRDNLKTVFSSSNTADYWNLQNDKIVSTTTKYISLCRLS